MPWCDKRQKKVEQHPESEGGGGRAVGFAAIFGAATSPWDKTLPPTLHIHNILSMESTKSRNLSNHFTFGGQKHIVLLWVLYLYKYFTKYQKYICIKISDILQNIRNTNKLGELGYQGPFEVATISEDPEYL